MKIHNIVYVSKYGYTKKYAEILANKLGVCAYSLKEAKKNIKKGEPIIFLSGLNNNRLNELKKVQKKYDITSILAVGMSFIRPTLPELVRIVNGFPEDFPLFYAQGGLDPNKISKLERFFLQVSLAPYNQITEPTEEDRMTVDMLGNAADYVSEDKLYEYYAYLLDDPSYLELIPRKETNPSLEEENEEQEKEEDALQ